ncbi:IS5 family transposase [Xanthobacteraceae bacterium A53D]
MSQSSFVDALLPAGFGRNARLERIAGLIDWAPVEKLVAPVRPGETGRPPYAPLSMFKALLLQQWYGLSDPGLEEALLDRVSFRRFCGLALDGATPDETTLCRFRNALKAAGLGEALFGEILRQLDAAGYVLKAGTLIDATLVESAVRPPPSGSTPRGQESRSPADPDANWTRTGQSRRLFFGYKAHVGVDQGSGLIRARLLTPAKTYESEVAEALILGDEGAVYADKAYEKRARREVLKARGTKDRIQHRSNKHQPALGRWLAVRNMLIGRVRGAVERTFSVLKRGYGLRRMRYRGLEANGFHLDLIAIAFNLRTAAARPVPAGR